MSANYGAPLCATQSGTLLPLSTPALSLATAGVSEMDQLLDNPTDLVCPITHECVSYVVMRRARQRTLCAVTRFGTQVVH